MWCEDLLQAPFESGKFLAKLSFLSSDQQTKRLSLSPFLNDKRKLSIFYEESLYCVKIVQPYAVGEGFFFSWRATTSGVCFLSFP